MAVVYVGNRATKTGLTGIDGLATVSPSKLVRAGDLLVMTVAVLGGLSPSDSITDTQGNEWQTDATALNTSRVAICSSVLAYELQPADVITLQLGASVTYALNLEEFSGVASPGWEDAEATSTGSNNVPSSGLTVTTAVAAEVAVGAWAINTAESSFTPNGGYVAFGIVSQVGLALLGQYLILSSTGQQQATAVVGTTGVWAGAIATYASGTDQPEIRGPDAFLTR